MTTLLRRTLAALASYRRVHRTGQEANWIRDNAPYLPPDGRLPRFPKRKNPVKRSKALLLSLEQEECARMVQSAAAPHGDLLREIRAGDVVELKLRTSITNPNAPLRTLVGLCIAGRRRGINSSFIIRNVYDGVAVEHTMMAYSPWICSAQILERRKYPRNKLYYLRERPLRESLVRAGDSSRQSASSNSGEPE
jgi:large subunit ribosomal protein L19